MSKLSLISSEIVALQATIPYLQPANGGMSIEVVDVRTALDFTAIPPPASIVEPAEEVPSPTQAPGPTHLTGGQTSATHYMRIGWDVFLIASNFGKAYDDLDSGMNDDPETGRKGIKSMIDDTFAACVGKTVASGTSKLFWGGWKRYTITDAKVIYVVRLWNDIVRT